MTNTNIRTLLSLMAKHECQDALWWSDDLEFYIKCSDMFCWGCADAETITDDDLLMLRLALEATDEGHGVSIHGPLLYCARRRGVRIQGAAYDYIDKKWWPLFDATGPKRTTGFGNPREHPDDRNEEEK